MVRMLLLVLATSACWRSHDSQATSPGEPSGVPASRARVDQKCVAFDRDDPGCASVCHRDAPDDWPGCESTYADLSRRGYTCTHIHPRTCRSPRQITSASFPRRARVIGVYVRGNHLEVTIGVGRMQGVSTSWKATLMDGNNPVPNGSITLTRVEPNFSVGTFAGTTAQVQRTPTVLVEP